MNNQQDKKNAKTTPPAIIGHAGGRPAGIMENLGGIGATFAVPIRFDVSPELAGRMRTPVVYCRGDDTPSGASLR